MTILEDNIADGKLLVIILVDLLLAILIPIVIVDGVFEAVERLGYDWNYDDKYVPPFLFA